MFAETANKDIQNKWTAVAELKSFLDVSKTASDSPDFAATTSSIAPTLATSPLSSQPALYSAVYSQYERESAKLVAWVRALCVVWCDVRWTLITNAADTS